FQYDEAYLAGGGEAVSYTLALQREAHVTEHGLHPYFDNLVAEGWLCTLQAKSIGVAPENRFALLLAYGGDCIGAISVRDPNPRNFENLEIDDPEAIAALASKSSLSGVQPKVGVVKTKEGYRPAVQGELSTYIAKFPGPIENLIENEYLTLKAS